MKTLKFQKLQAPQAFSLKSTKFQIFYFWKLQISKAFSLKKFVVPTALHLKILNFQNL